MGTAALVEHIKRITALADTGLLYANSGYEIDRYQELKQISLNMLSELSGKPVEVLSNYYLPLTQYPTVKVDVRGLVLNANNEILLVKEQSDGLWSIPGGWADIGFSPSEAIIKEVKEEAGLDVTIDRVLAVFDNRKQVHPPQPYYIYKLILLCKLQSESLQKGFDILDVKFFNPNELPPLSENRILKTQIELLHQRVLAGLTETLFD